MALVQDELGNWYDDGTNDGNSGDDPGGPNLEGGDLGQTESQAQDDFYRSIGLDPATIKDSPPEEKAKIDAILKGDLYGASPDLVKTLMGAFQKTVNGKTSFDWDKVGMVGGLLAKATGLSKPETPGYKGAVKKYTAVSAPVQYDDTNRRPGSQGRSYFSPTQYVPEGGDVNAAHAAAVEQAKGIAAAYKPPTAPADKWGVGAAVPAVAMPWARKAETATPPTAKPYEPMLTPEEKLAQLKRAGMNPAPAVQPMPPDEGFEPWQQHNMDLEGPGFDYSGGASKAPTYDPRFNELAKAASASHGGGDIATMDYTSADQARDSYLRSVNPSFNANREADMARMASQAAQQVQHAAQGGIMAAKGRYLRGETDGMADKINTSIDDTQPAKLSHGEFVVPADVVSHLGNGNSDAGAKKLYQMMDKIRIARTGTKKQGRQINPDKYMPGGSVGYSSGGITDGIQRFTTGGPASGTSTAGNLADWAGDAITTNIGKGIAAADQPYQGYTGQLTAGPSNLEQQAFAGASNIASTGLTPTQFTGGTWSSEEAQKYMNPYLKQALDPQLEELRRQAQINLQSGLGKYTQSGGYGGGRQAILESEAMRNLMQEQNKTVGQGYSTAYDKAMDAYNKGRQQQLDVEKAQQAANEASANFGIKSVDELANLGKTQREIEQAGLTADKTQFEEQRDWDKKMAQYKQGLFSGLPVSTQVNTQNVNPLTEWLQSGSQLSKLLEAWNKPAT